MQKNQLKKPNPQFHGFGVKSIANVVKRYDGEMTFYYDDPSKT
ncbi:MAG: GHKL domain-containing protein, partial [Agathobacter sp.]|nr:GHKL domain-containing protein [Agathobacter sp.]